jgi:sugar/nucleoside kinase (ribokinase family)
MVKILTVGHACVDFVHGVTDHLIPSKKLDSVFSNIQLGGSAVNVAIALKNLGADVTVCTTLGSKSDITTTIFKQLIDAKGIDIVCNHIDNAATANSLVTVLPNGERSITCYQSNELVEDDTVDIDVASYDIVLGDNYRLPLVSKIFEQASLQSIKTMLDIDKSIQNIKKLPPATYTWLSYEAWCSLREQQRDLKYLYKMFSSVVGFTQGADPVNWVDSDGFVKKHKPKFVNVTNSLGAGDVFRASLAVQLCMNIPLATAIERACESAGEHISGKRLTKII